VLQLPVPATAQFLAIVLLTLGISIAIIEVARRSRLGSLLLGMQFKSRAQPARPAPRVPEQEPETARAPTPALVSS
jgi:hypothetical protein